jgi:hypothetical protein
MLRCNETQNFVLYFVKCTPSVLENNYKLKTRRTHKNFIPTAPIFSLSLSVLSGAAVVLKALQDHIRPPGQLLSHPW